MEATNIILSFLVATLKKKKKSKKEQMKLNLIFYLTQDIENIISTCNEY